MRESVDVKRRTSRVTTRRSKLRLSQVRRLFTRIENPKKTSVPTFLKTFYVQVDYRPSEAPPFFVRPFEPTQLQQEKLFFASNFASNKMWVNGSISHDLNVAKKFKLVECKNIGLFCPKVCWILLPSHGVTSVWRNGCRVMNKLSHRGSRCRFRNQRCCQFWQISIVVGGGVVVTTTK